MLLSVVILCALQKCRGLTSSNLEKCAINRCGPGIFKYNRAKINQLEQCLVNTCGHISKERKVACLRKCQNNLQERQKVVSKFTLPSMPPQPLQKWLPTYRLTSKRSGITESTECDFYCKLSNALTPEGRLCVIKECSNSQTISSLVECATLQCGSTSYDIIPMNNLKRLDDDSETESSGKRFNIFAGNSLPKRNDETNKPKEKRWAERVCMETHCGHVTSNSPQYFMCGSQFCHGG